MQFNLVEPLSFIWDSRIYIYIGAQQIYLNYMDLVDRIQFESDSNIFIWMGMSSGDDNNVTKEEILI